MKKNRNVIVPSKHTSKRQNSIFKNLIYLLYPKRCPICGGVIGFNKEEYHKKCYDKLPVVNEPFCNICGAPLSKYEDELCNDCQNRSHIFTSGRGLYERSGVTRLMIYNFKYKYQRDIGKFMGKELAYKFNKQLLDWEIDAIVPVPLYKKRMRMRGFNQSEDIAVALSDELYDKYDIKIPVYPNLVMRTKDTKKQKDLSVEERKDNVCDAFALGAKLKRVPQNILIIDDIYTTGATIDAVAKPLLKRGAGHVYFLAVCTSPML